MPIHKSQKHLYPANWKIISKRIRVERAKNRCEWCYASHGLPHPVTRSIVRLQVAHLDHRPQNIAEANLVALCQRCHNHYDQPMRLLNRKTRGKAKVQVTHQRELIPSTEGRISIPDFINQQKKHFARLFPASRKSLNQSK